ncbi:deubiquitinating protein VCPIP1-like [Mytilus californianus]|uniref:deubiquitinating protein VCPIP1-like n=1 Tax=Mytilus californianus TaxID=6549 RepID=UPI002246FF5A|nr:deubiquitinating protein VCPIP1-like [Mytilus californianus]
MEQAISRRREDYKVLCGTCPDEQCRAKLFFPAYDKSIECTSCGQRHEKSTLQNIAEVTNPSVALHNILKNILLGNVKPKKGADNVKVLGLSNYVCKLVSPILTRYGMCKKTGKAQLLTELGQPPVFDCGKILGDRAFVIDEENLSITGYGRDKSGSLKYLSGTLDVIKDVNDGEERLVAIHADGDGHCLVHAVSRALVGRELFWHALRVNLMNHFNENLDRYKDLFKDFVDRDEWNDIIQECHPEFCPRDGEPLGLRNIHVFGLANVLRRPIILLDSIEGMQSSGDYSAVFLPGLIKPEECKSKDGSFNKPICIAWSSVGRNHYISLVGIKGKPPPKIPRYMIQKTWGMSSTLLDKYIELDEYGHCIVGGDKCLSDKYLRHLVSAMEEVYFEKHGVHQQLVADVHQFMYKTSGIVGVLPEEVLKTTQRAVREKKLYRCLTCDGVMEYILPPEWFRKGGSLYNIAIKTQGALKPDKKYQFPMQGVVCNYDAEKDVLIPDMANSQLSICSFCQGAHVRLVKGDGTVKYENGDRTTTPAPGGRCTCGFKHYWDGREYDNLPEIFPISMEWNGEVVAEKVMWFQYESNDSLNSNVFEVAQKLVQKHFPGEFGSERLVQQVVNTILRRTAGQKKDPEKSVVNPYSDESFSADTASKIILTGHAHKTLHKEELCKSEKEKQVKKRITSEAQKHQQKKTAEVAATSTQKSSPKKSKSLDSGMQSKTTTSTDITKTSSKLSSPRHTGEKKVKIATSDGRQMMLTLPEEVTYDQLKNLIAEQVSVSPVRQRLRTGFPPKELKQPENTGEIIPLLHGDKISVEILPDKSVPMEIDRKASTKDYTKVSEVPSAHRSFGAWSSFEEDAHGSTEEALLRALKATEGASDSLDSSIASLAIMSTVTGRDLWTYVQTMPHLFSVGGLFYKQMERDLGLVDGKHCQLPALPGKVFRYNAHDDRLELCLEPHGHFQVEPRIEEKVKEMVASGKLTEARFGSSGAVGRHSPRMQAFAGQGHSLRPAEIEKMPGDLPEPVGHHHHHQVRKLQNLCDPDRHEESICEESEEILEDAPSEQSQEYQKLGPGYSVISSENVNQSNENLQLFKDLAQSIEETMNEDIADINKEMERIDSEERMKSSVCSSDMLSHVPSISSMSDTVFESEAEKDNPRIAISEGNSCAINSTNSDKMEVNMECSDTGLKRSDKELCDVIKIDSSSAAASLSQQVKGKKTVDKMEENSGCPVSLSVDTEKPETITSDGQDESVCYSSDQQEIELKIDESKCQPDPMTQNNKLIPETKLEKDGTKSGSSAQTKTDEDKEMDTS